ncbi:hypothetical protein RRG08_022273 [Elysia crispata]|uniref:Carboxylesterase type B domain-containing protein n=1 Tax=Elysia crispata TaxID=231223 RepID=A0AAE1DL97_9GAST|nr:hypothetical protein RRG08_022273 [Elysia crispata]
MIKGSIEQSKDFVYVAYKSIPFAEPPVGELRFKRPQPLSKPQRSMLNSDDYKKSCWSATKTSPSKYYSEDCLYLNVYVPVGVNGTYPVMVWLHGGGFVAGSTFPEPGKMVQQGQVIVVTVNYRLGVFGFLTTQDDIFPSNNGLWDQYMAIKWVHGNIQYFNGNSSSITLFGESAGAVSTALHVISPISSKYFHKVILQSGAMTSTISRKPQDTVKRFAELVGCTTHSGTLMKPCLKNVDIDSVLKYSKPEWYVSNPAQKQVDFVWSPVIDGEFILEEPLSLINNISFMEQQRVFNKDYMIGVLNDEGALLTTNFFYPVPVTVLEDSKFMRDLEYFLFLNRYGLKTQISTAAISAARSFYTGRANESVPPPPTSVLDFCGDTLLVAPAVEAALAFTQEEATKKAKTFFYHFDFCPATTELEAPCFAHGEEVKLQFPKKKITDPVETKLSDLFISLLTQFAKSSDPGTVVDCGWPEYEPQERHYLRISPSPDIRTHLYQYRMQFWLTTMPCILRGGSYCK